MSAEVDWALDQLGAVVDSVATDYDHRNGGNCILKRVDRDNSRVYDGSETVDMTEPMHKRKAKLKTGNYVGVTLADRDPSVLGFEYNHEVDLVLGVRVEGLTHREYGHIDPDGDQGIPFSQLVHDIKHALLNDRTYPSVPDALDTEYYTAQVTNEDPNSAAHRDYYRWSFDLVLSGDETLP